MGLGGVIVQVSYTINGHLISCRMQEMIGNGRLMNVSTLTCSFEA